MAQLEAELAASLGQQHRLQQQLLLLQAVDLQGLCAAAPAPPPPLSADEEPPWGV